MQVYPDMNIRFPETREAELEERLKSRARAPWQWQEVPKRLSPREYLCFHRDEADPHPACSLFIRRGKPGHWVVVNIFRDAPSRDRMSIEQYVGILNEFERLIAEPAAEAVGGLTSIDTHVRTLADYFSTDSIEHLECFCTTSNASTLGDHPSDQHKWRCFLLSVYRCGKHVDPDTFGALLEATGWWPKRGIRKLVDEYELAMELLQLEERTRVAG